MPTIEYIRRFPKEAYGYEEVKAVCETVEELAEVMLAFETWRMERPINPQDIPFEDGPPPEYPGEDVPFDEPQPRRQAPDRQNTRAQGGVKCGICGGATWSNVEKKIKGEFSSTTPDYKCRDKANCGAAMWLTKDGQHGEWKQ